jgi:hypothetical protein
MCNLSVSASFAKGASLLGFLCVVAGSRAASARDRLAVAVIADGDLELGDSLTEAAISSLAERGNHELVGARELRVRLVDVPDAPALEACIVQPACLAGLGSAVGARRAVIGAVRKNGTDVALELSLVETDSSAIVAKWSRIVRQDAASMVAAVATGAGELFAAKVAAPVGAPAPATLAPDATPPPATPALLHLDAQPTKGDDGDRRSAARFGYLGATALALAVVAFSAAAVTGSVAEAPLLGDTRADMQGDLSRREDYATAANGLLVAGGALSAAAAGLFAWWWRADRTNSR